jgi:hypothetical protein
MEENNPKRYFFDVPYDLGFGIVKIKKTDLLAMTNTLMCILTIILI